MKINLFRIILLVCALPLWWACSNDPLKLIENKPDAGAGNDSFSLAESVEQDWIRVKLNENDDVVRRAAMRRSFPDGISVLNKVAAAMGGIKMIPVFADGGKYKERRMKYGLHLWYDVYVGEDVHIKQKIKSIKELSFVDIAETIPVDRQTSSRQSNVYPWNVGLSMSGVLTDSNVSGGNGKEFNDPYLSRQWHYFNDGSTASSVAGADANIFPAWKVTTGHPDVIVAVVDGGIDYSHPDLAANMWINKAEMAGNGIDDDGNGYVDDIYGYRWGREGVGESSGDILPMDHGSHCAGTVAAVNNNGIGVAGVAGGNGKPSTGVRIMSCQTYLPDPAKPEDPYGNSKSTSQTPDAFAYAADNGAVIVNCSFSYSGTTLSAAYKAGIDYFIDNAGVDEKGNQTGPMKGGLMVASAGNDGQILAKYPAAYERVISVAYSMSNYKKSPSSNYGPTIDITAPGGATSGSYAPDRIGGIFSTIPMASGNYDVVQGYAYKSGTSMAAPHVAGIAALVLSAAVENNISMTVEKLRDILERSCWSLDKYNPEYAGMLGHGQIDAGFAIQLLLGGEELYVNQPKDVMIATDYNSLALSWIVPTDYLGYPVVQTQLYIGMSPLDKVDFNKELPLGVKKEIIENNKKSGEQESFKFSNLAKGTKYYFALIATDRQGLASEPLFIEGTTKDDAKKDNPKSLFTLYPNPLKDMLNVIIPAEAITKKVDVMIFNSNGNKVFSYSTLGGTDPIKVNVKALTGGVYTVRLKYLNISEEHTVIKY